MIERLILAAAVVTMSTGSALAMEPIELNNTYPTTEQSWELDGSWFFTQDNKGSFEVVKGPFEDGPARCIGSGFVYPDGKRRISGICIFGEGEDTFTMSWATGDKDAANTRHIAAGTGKYKCMTGEGVSTTGTLNQFQALRLRQTHITGFVDIPGK